MNGNKIKYSISGGWTVDMYRKQQSKIIYKENLVKLTNNNNDTKCTCSNYLDQ